MDLADRVARCTCGKEVPSSTDLAFFEYRGDGSISAVKTCRHCWFTDVAHERARDLTQTHLAKVRGHEFEACGGFAYDIFYCGCRGWN